MVITSDNYYTPEANREYWSVSQFKTFYDCEARAMAELDGRFVREPSKALMMGSYVDAHFSGEMPQFVRDNPEIFKKNGDLRAEYIDCQRYIARAERDPMFMHYMDGDKQVIMTAELFGQPWKIKIDCLRDDCIVDLKTMRDMKPVKVGGEWKTFVEAYQYDLQGFIYQKVVEEVTGKHLPFILAVITKEEHPDLALIELPDWLLNSAGELVKHYIDHYAEVKAGVVDPEPCGVCGWCRDNKKLDAVVDYENYFKEGN